MFSLFFFLATDYKATMLDRFLYILTEMCSVCTYIYIHFFTQMETLYIYFLSDFPKVTQLIGDGAETCNQENLPLKPVFYLLC